MDRRLLRDGMVTPRERWRKPVRAVAVSSRSALLSQLYLRRNRRAARSEFEVDANRFDQALRVQFPGAKGRLQPISNRLPLFLVLDGKRRKKLSQMILNCVGNSRSCFAGKRSGNAKHVGAVLSDVLVLYRLALRSARRQVEVRARLQRNQRGWICKSKILFFIVLFPDQRIVIIIE